MKNNNEQELPFLKDNSERAKILLLTFKIYIGFIVVALISGWMQLDLLQDYLNGEPIDDSAADANDIREMIVAIIQTVGYIVTIVVFLNWFRRAYGNINRLGMKTNYSESMSVWYFFIPIISLFRPVKIMNEIWSKTQKKIKSLDANYYIDKNSYLIVFWWTLFICSNLLGNYLFRSSLSDVTVEDFISTTKGHLLSDFLQIIEAIFVILIVKKTILFDAKINQILEIETIST